MHKLPIHFESHVDRFIYFFVELVSPYMNNTSPNTITTIGILFDLVAFYMFYLKKFEFGVFMYFIGYYFDCLDGYVARLYNKTSVFGDYYDHFSDFIKNAGTILLLYRLSPKLFLKSLPFMIIIVCFVLMHFHLQEMVHDKAEDSPTLKTISQFVKTIYPYELNPQELLPYTRFFGAGNIYLFVILMILYFARSERKNRIK